MILLSISDISSNRLVSRSVIALSSVMFGVFACAMCFV